MGQPLPTLTKEQHLQYMNLLQRGNAAVAVLTPVLEAMQTLKELIATANLLPSAPPQELLGSVC